MSIHIVLMCLVKSLSWVCSYDLCMYEVYRNLIGSMTRGPLQIGEEWNGTSKGLHDEEHRGGSVDDSRKKTNYVEE